MNKYNPIEPGVMAQGLTLFTPESHIDTSLYPGCFASDPVTCLCPGRAVEDGEGLGPMHSIGRPGGASCLLSLD